MCGLIAQLVEHRTGIAQVTGSNPVEALIFSGFFFPIAYIGNLTAMIILHFHPQPQFKYELFHTYFTSFHCTGGYELNKSASLPMCGSIAQLVEHRTGIAEVRGSNPVEALIFSGFFFPIAYIGKFTAMIILYFKLFLVVTLLIITETKRKKICFFSWHFSSEKCLLWMSTLKEFQPACSVSWQ